MGPFVIAVDGLGRLSTGWQRPSWPAADLAATKARSRPDLLPGLSAELDRYFSGARSDFSDVPLPDGTDFQRACWAAARRVPHGKTISYTELARRAGSPSAARAAGQCMRTNPTPILVPCHRIVASDGALRGFGGATDPLGRELALKGWLIELERTER